MQNRRPVEAWCRKSGSGIGQIGENYRFAERPELAPQSFVIGDVVILSLAVGSRERKVSMTEIAAYHR
jgi:hypothetical protein